MQPAATVCAALGRPGIAPGAGGVPRCVTDGWCAAAGVCACVCACTWSACMRARCMCMRMGPRAMGRCGRGAAGTTGMSLAPWCSVPGGTAVNWMIPGWLPLQGPVHRGYPGASALICDHLRGGGTPGVPMGPAPRRLLPESPRIAKPGAGANPVRVSWMGPAGLHGTCTIGPAPLPGGTGVCCRVGAGTRPTHATHRPPRRTRP